MRHNRKSKVINITNFGNFNGGDKVETESFYNYNPTDGLYNSLGVDVAKIPADKGLTDRTLELDLSSLNGADVQGVIVFKQYSENSGSEYRFLVYGSDGKLYINQMFYGLNKLYWVFDNLQFNDPPIPLAYKRNDIDVMIFASKDKMTVWRTNYSPYVVTDAPIITSMCYYDEILFCTIVEPGYKVWYSTDFSAENVGDISATSDYISLDDDLGYARKIINFDENVYVFRDYGITKISHFNKKFSTSTTYVTNTQILSNTISVCGNQVLFMTRDGLYTFNGIKVTRANIDIDEMLTGLTGSEVASSLGNKYYLSLRLNFNDDKQILCEQGDYVNNAVIVINIDDFSYQIIRGVDIGSFFACKTEYFESMLVTFNSVHQDKVGQIVNYSKCFDENLPKYWCSGLLSDNYNRKLMTRLTVLADKDVKFNLIHDTDSVSFTTYQTGLNEFSFKISSNTIKLEISSESESAKVENISLEYYEY